MTDRARLPSSVHRRTPGTHKRISQRKARGPTGGSDRKTGPRKAGPIGHGEKSLTSGETESSDPLPNPLRARVHSFALFPLRPLIAPVRPHSLLGQRLLSEEGETQSDGLERGKVFTE
jgi:hypothetical protein